MLYMFNEYVKEFPNNLAVLNKLTACEKNLHEMTADEINAITATWTPLTETTVRNQMWSLNNYFNWLADKGVTCVAKVEDIKIPTKDKEFRIFSTVQLHAAWEELLVSMERYALKHKIFFGRDKFRSLWAIDTLCFYGLTEDEILALRLADVQPDGVEGYDLPLTEQDIEVLMACKELKIYQNRRHLDGAKFIRTATGEDVSKEVTRQMLSVNKCEEDKKSLKKMLSAANVFKLGTFDRIYKREQETGEYLKGEGYTIPDWFIRFAEEMRGGKVSPNTLTAYRKDYLAYRDERIAYEEEHPEEFNVESQPVVEEVTQPEETQNSNLEDILGRLIADVGKMQATIAELAEYVKNKK